MMLPPSCKTVLVNPRTNITIPQVPSTFTWLNTDLQYSLVLSKLSHVIIMYQYSGQGQRNNYYITNHIKINSAIQKHTVYHSGYSGSLYYGNFGLWQGSLNPGTHTILVEHRNNGKTTSKDTAWETRALHIIYC